MKILQQLEYLQICLISKLLRMVVKLFGSSFLTAREQVKFLKMANNGCHIIIYMPEYNTIRIDDANYVYSKLTFTTNQIQMNCIYTNTIDIVHQISYV